MHCGGCRKDDTFHDFKFVTKELIFLLVQTFLKVVEKYHFTITSILPPLSPQKLETFAFFLIRKSVTNKISMHLRPY